MGQSANEIAAMLLWILLGFLLIHVVNGTGTQWITSFFSPANKVGSGASGTLNPDGTRAK